jgi:hypothetical protein
LRQLAKCLSKTLSPTPKRAVSATLSPAANTKKSCPRALPSFLVVLEKISCGLKKFSCGLNEKISGETLQRFAPKRCFVSPETLQRFAARFFR